MHESESVTSTNKEWADRTVRRLTYLHQFLFSIFSFPSIKRNGRPTRQLGADRELKKKKFKNVIRNNFNDLLPIQFSTASFSLVDITVNADLPRHREEVF